MIKVLNHNITQSFRLERISWGHQVDLPTESRINTDCKPLCSVGPWKSPRIEVLQHHWLKYSNPYLHHIFFFLTPSSNFLYFYLQTLSLTLLPCALVEPVLLYLSDITALGHLWQPPAEVRNRQSVRSLPIQATLWFYNLPEGFL